MSVAGGHPGVCGIILRRGEGRTRGVSGRTTIVSSGHDSATSKAFAARRDGDFGSERSIVRGARGGRGDGDGGGEGGIVLICRP